jgi:hypothetical protein
MAHPGEVLQGFVTARMQVPTPELSSEVAGGLGTRRRTEVDEVLPPAMLRPPGSKRIAQTVEPFVWVGPAPILIFAVDNLRLLRMKRQPTLGKPLLQLLPQALCLRLRLTMTNRVIGIPFDRDVRVVPLPPPIERIMHEEIRQQRAPLPPCGVPVAGWRTCPSVSSTPAFSHFLMSRKNAPSSMRSSNIRTNQPCSMLSKTPLMAASTTK